MVFDCSAGTNGWPVSNVPETYTSDGNTRGSFGPLFEGATDQYGNANVDLGQFYGSMILLSVGAEWCGPCQAAAQGSNELWHNINASQDNYQFWTIEVLFQDLYGEESDNETGFRWAGDYGIEYPIIVGPVSEEARVAYGVTSFPTFFVLDPDFKIRAVDSGFGGDAALRRMVIDGYSRFTSDFPDWERACDPYEREVEPGCGNLVVEDDEECDSTSGGASCRDLDEPRAEGNGLTCSEECTFDDSTCGLAFCGDTGSESLTYGGTVDCGSSGFLWDIFELSVDEGDCVHIKVDNGGGDADPVAYMVDSAGVFSGLADDYLDLDDEVSCTNAPWGGGGCIDSSFTASASGTVSLAVAQWGGSGCSDGSEYALSVAVNGTDMDLSAGPTTTGSSSLP
ncbi:MAG: hypothetical protein CL927_16800 [Deltaproteobacteria bacterium]|nr:hypothetical protein [Deltaproteobacteria bacterium]